MAVVLTVVLTVVSLIAGWIPGLKQKHDGQPSSRPTLAGWFIIGLTLAASIYIGVDSNRDARAKDEHNNELRASLTEARRGIERSNEQEDLSRQDLVNLKERLADSQKSQDVLQAQLTLANTQMEVVRSQAAIIQKDASVVYGSDAELQIWKDAIENAVDYIYLKSIQQTFILKQCVASMRYADECAWNDKQAPKEKLTAARVVATEEFIREYEGAVRVHHNTFAYYQNALAYFKCDMSPRRNIQIEVRQTEAEIKSLLEELRTNYSKLGMDYANAEKLYNAIYHQQSQLHYAIQLVVKDEHLRRLMALLPENKRINHALLTLDRMPGLPVWANGPLTSFVPVDAKNVEPLLPLPLKPSSQVVSANGASKPTGP